MFDQHPIIDFDPVFLAMGPFDLPLIGSIGPLSIHWYGITYLIGFACYYILGIYRINKYPSSWNKDQLSDFLFYAAMGIIGGGRLGWVLFYNDDSLIADPFLPFRIWEGGMSFHGGLIGVLIAMWYFKNKTKRSFFAISDFIVPLVPTGILSVRIGNFLNGELWGRLTDKPWGMIFPDSLPFHLQTENMAQGAWQNLYDQGQLDVFARHPSTLYEAFGEGLVTFIVVWIVAHYSKVKGTVSAAFLLSYGIARFTVEFFREPDANRGFIAFDWMTMGHILTIPILLLGMLILIKNRGSVKAS